MYQRVQTYQWVCHTIPWTYSDKPGMGKRSNKTDTPWISNWEEMAKKTVIRRLTKYLPMSIELANATALDERAEVGKPQGLGAVLEGDYTVTAADDPDGDATVDPETGEVNETKSLPQPNENPLPQQIQPEPDPVTVSQSQPTQQASSARRRGLMAGA